MSREAQALIERLAGMDAGEFLGGGFEALAEKARDAKEAPDELAMQYLRTFDHPAGRAVLEDLVERTLHRATWVPDDPERMGYFREGQNSVVAMILSMMNKARMEQASG